METLLPIKPELRHLYGREWRTITRPRILERAGNKCECCGAPNHTTVLRAFDWWTPSTLEALVFLHRGRIHGKEVTELPWTFGKHTRVSHFPHHKEMKWSAIQIGIAHLDHDPTHEDDDNLAAFCRRCHLIYDLGKHRDTRATRKDQARPIITRLLTESPPA